MENDRELLEYAAKAAGLRVNFHPAASYRWNPLTDDGDALRLAVKLGFCVHTNGGFDDDETEIAYVYDPSRKKITEQRFKVDIYEATRRAIVRAAAEIGKQMNGT